jgi:transglutaminase-like putative cysteine protease
VSNVAEPTRFSDARPAATLTLALLTAITVVSLCRIFPDWDYLRPMLAFAIGMHAIAFVLRVVRAPLWVALPSLLLALFVLVGIIYYRDTLSFVFPSGRTVELMRVDLRLVVDQFATAVAPVPSEGSFATATAAVVGLCVVLSDTFAFRALGQVEAVVPSGVLFVFTSALGTDRYRVLMAVLWIGAALLTIAVLRFSNAEQDGGWMGSRRVTFAAALPAIVLTVGASAVMAGAIAPRLPGAGEKALVDTRNRQGNVTEVLSPLVDIRARMKNRGNAELFTVQSDDGAHYWRVLGLPNFDGNSWSPPEEDLREMGDRSSELLLPGRRVSQVYTIKAMGGPLVPAVYQPVQVSPDAVFWADESDSLVLSGDTLERDDVIAVASIVIDPTVEQLRAATVSGAESVYYELPGGIPDTASDLAAELTASAATPYDRAMALQAFFRDNFTYDLDVQLGNSNDAIEVFLRDRRGFCQQFAGTFAAMARSIGLPARVAVGYTPGDIGNDGLYHVYGRHAHAWPEVWFDGIGWVAFEPTPSRGNPDAAQYTGVAAQQDDSRGTGGSNGGPSQSTPSSVPGGINEPGITTTVPGGGRPGTGGPNGSSTTLPPVSAGGGGSGSSVIPLVLLGGVVLLVLWILLAPRVIAVLQRPRSRTPRDRVIGAWQRACHVMTVAGAPPVGGATPIEYARAAEAAVGVSHVTVRELAVQVTRAVYSPAQFDEQIAERCETLEDDIDAFCRTITPWRLRLRALVDPRMMRRRIAG